MAREGEDPGNVVQRRRLPKGQGGPGKWWFREGEGSGGGRCQGEEMVPGRWFEGAGGEVIQGNLSKAGGAGKQEHGRRFILEQQLEGAPGRDCPGREMGPERRSWGDVPGEPGPGGRWWPRGGGTGNEEEQRWLRGSCPGTEIPWGWWGGAAPGDAVWGRSWPGELEEGPGRGCGGGWGIRAGRDRSLRDVARRQGHTALPGPLLPPLCRPQVSGAGVGTPAL